MCNYTKMEFNMNIFKPLKRRMEYNDILIISDKFYDTFGER